MNRMIARGLRRLAVAAAAGILAVSATAIASSPAHAAEPPPGCSYGAGHYEQAGSYIAAYRYWFCDDGNDIPLSLSIQRYLSPGVYQTVASGMGDVIYYCTGTNYNVYRITGIAEFGILCS